jgi:methionyl-tRNA formyltransferase
MKQIKIGYFADGPWSHLALKNILSNPTFKIDFICVRFDTQDPTLAKAALDLNVPLLAHHNINSEEFIKKVSDFKSDIFVSMSFNQIFKKTIIDLTPLKIINCHAGLLPYYRGRNILNWALINDEKEFGVTVHYVDEGIDTGDIILQKKISINDDDSYKSLLTKAYTECADVLFEALVQISENKVKRIPQNSISEYGLYCGQRKKGDELINWNQSSRQLFNFIRGVCSPGPMATTFADGVEVKINKSSFYAKAPSYIGIPGQVLSKTREGFLVKTSDSYIEIKEVVSNKKIKVGDRFK